MAAPGKISMKLVNVIRKHGTFLQCTPLFKREFRSSGRMYVLEKLGSVEIPDSEFRVLVIPGHTKLDDKKGQSRTKKKEVPPARYKRMSVDQDWTKVWPAAETFKWSVVPFPVRQGMAEGEENDGIPPSKYANAELMKIPNFLHLTPAHIKKQCQAIRKFCTSWPAELDTDEKCSQHFPVSVETADYLTDGASLRDARARKVTVTVPLSILELDYHARDKFLRLARTTYNPVTDELTLVSDRCPLKKQNYDFCMYLLTALYHESWKVEDWEAEKTVADMEAYFWDLMPSKKVLLETIRQHIKMGKEFGPIPDVMASLPEKPSDEDIVETQVVQRFKSAISDLHNGGENLDTLDAYKTCVKELLLPFSSKDV